MYKIFAKITHQASNMNYYCKNDEVLLRKRRDVVVKMTKFYCENDETLRKQRDEILKKRRNVNKFVVTCHYLKTSFLFKYEVKRYIHLLMSKK
jgi:hypothetical protein